MQLKINYRGDIQDIDLQCVIDNKDVTSKIIRQYDDPLPYDKFMKIAQKICEYANKKKEAGHEIEIYYAVGGYAKKASLIVISDYLCPFDIQAKQVKKKSLIQKIKEYIL